ncbi:MAG: LptF/LptG family permease [Elusimicrobia bacterium]|nr:LptF/LptG family permease [Elusimicrobiota bacterium]
MPILPKYLYRLYLPAFGLCIAVCAGVMVMKEFIRLFNLAVAKGISPLWILACFARLLPNILSMAVPIAFLVALLLTLGALSESGEVMALRASGFSFREVLQPFFYLAVGLSLLLFYLNHKAGPEGYHSFRKSLDGALSQLSRLDIEPGAFAALGDWSLYPKRVDEESGRLEDVYLVRRRGERKGIRIEAPEGSVRLEKGAGFRLALKRGSLYFPQTDPTKLLSATFDEFRMMVPLTQYVYPNRPLDIQEMNSLRLLERSRDEKTAASHRSEYLTEIAVRAAGALTPFVFFWLVCPLGLILEKHARARGFALSLGVLLVYYGLMAVGIGLGRRHLSLSLIAPWLPVAAGLCAAAYLWRRYLRV